MINPKVIKSDFPWSETPAGFYVGGMEAPRNGNGKIYAIKKVSAKEWMRRLAKGKK